MKRGGAALLGVVVLSGCAYYNTLYNSERLLEEADAYYRSGQDSLAAARYQDVIRKTSDAYRGQPSGEQSVELLVLLGRAQLRVGRVRDARAALELAEGRARDSALRAQILLYLGHATADLGNESEALAYAGRALRLGVVGPASGEAYLLRGRLRLQGADVPAGWADLEEAAAHEGLMVDARLEGLRWSVHYGALDRARTALAALLLDSSAEERRDTVSALVSAASERWSPSVAGELLADVNEAAWERPARNALELQRARLLRSAGDTVAAEAHAWRIAAGRGEGAADARLLLSRWHLDRTSDLGDAQAVVPILLPVGDDPRAAGLVAAVGDLTHFTGLGLDDPLGWFAAAEVAQDRLAAPMLARGLYLAYADTDPEDPWAPKALLAALTVASDEEDRSWLRGRLEAHPNSPYVQAARGSSAAAVESLEEELQERLREIASR